VPAPASPNFGFLAVHDKQLVQAAADAERLFAEHPHASLMMLRLFGELLAQRVAASAGLYANYEENQANLLGRLKAQSVISRDVADMFHTLRKVGNAASHQLQGDHRQALQLLRMARELGVWFHRAFGGTPGFHPGPFVPPPDPRGETQALAAQLKELREALSQAQGAQEAARTLAEHEAHLRSEAESKAAKADEERAQWEELALLTDAEKAKTAAELHALQAQRIEAPSQAQAFVAQAAEAGERVVLDEHQTRLLIDQQLRDAGWDADTEALTFNGGARPELGKAKAIAEWPTDSGPADYALFLGLICVGVVEAKRQNIDAAGAIAQAKRYARGVRNVELPEGSPYREFRVPFLFSSNGRGYLRQLKDKSGVHFLDVRRPQNHPDPLEGWYTPGGLKELLAQDVDAADQRLRQEQTDYLNLRDYQVKAIKAVEQGLEAGQREMLVAMATGTGKTKMCIGLLYRLLKTKRTRRVLFLVDRSSLGTQSKDAFVEMRLENLQTFADIFEVKGLKDLKPEKETKVHIATIQAMVKRILFTDEGVPPVDAYDCIIVDECHRGYLLDRELDDDELNFRDEADYISKYRRVLDHFDAVKIGLTATPALHTVDIFGKPVFTYCYREAVIDGFLVDHDPPLQITTALAEDGMTWKAGEEMAVIDRETGDVDTVTLPDDVQLEIESYNRRVITESFNRVVCERLAHHIDPQLFEKTIVFCVTDAHADLVVRLLKEAFDRQYGGVDDDLVCKITGKSDRPEQLIRLFKNERAPSVAVTVDLLTTGIDVPAVANIVFLRRIRSRILYDQMLGRATRLCPEIGKSTFRVFDAVDLYDALAPLTDMKPVVVNPKISFEARSRTSCARPSRACASAWSTNCSPSCGPKSAG
jgi:type I restriction enzyme R subunit